MHQQKLSVMKSVMLHFAVGLVALLFLSSKEVAAQKWALSTNAVDYVYLGTLNLEGSAALSQHLSIHLGVRYNPWTFNNAKTQFQDRQQTYKAGIRYWLWNTYSGWWFYGGGQYREYNRGGLIGPETEEGDAFGAGLSAGYSLMINKHFNLDFGLGLWGGMTSFTLYSCPQCGRLLDSGTKFFCTYDNLLISLAWIF